MCDHDLFIETPKYRIELEKAIVVKELELCKTIQECNELKKRYLGSDSFVETAIRALDGKEESFSKLLKKMGVV